MLGRMLYNPWGRTVYLPALTPIKINHSWIGTYTNRPMDTSWDKLFICGKFWGKICRRSLASKVWRIRLNHACLHRLESFQGQGPKDSHATLPHARREKLAVSVKFSKKWKMVVENGSRK